MNKYIDSHYWRDALSRPDWYLLLREDFSRLEKLAQNESDYNVRKSIKNEAYTLVEEAIQSGTLPIADQGDDFDIERKPIDTIVIHHTKNKPGMTLGRLNAMHIMRIYGAYFANPADPSDQHLKGMPVWSGHFYQSQQVFWGYHWFIRGDGTAEQILDDQAIGWHAGNWDVNTRSVGICIDDDLTDREPNGFVLGQIAQIIKQHYPAVTPENIIGHCEANAITECPSRLFVAGWKERLLGLVDGSPASFGA